jgi:hypothetical protein
MSSNEPSIIKCTTNKNQGPPCPDGFYGKKNGKGEDCCYKLKNTDQKQRNKTSDNEQREQATLEEKAEKERKKQEKAALKDLEKERKKQEKAALKDLEKERKKQEKATLKDLEKAKKKAEKDKEKQNEQQKKKNDEKKRADSVRTAIQEYKKAYGDYDFSPEISPTEWVPINRKAFPTWVTKTFQIAEGTGQTANKSPPKSCEMKEERLALFPHQKIIRDYLQHRSPYRGLLLYHGLGVGKTCASISVAEILMRHRNVIVMSPASLRMNYINEVLRCGHEKYTINQHWKFHKVSKEQYEEVSKMMGIDPTHIKTMQGIWLSYPDKPPNYETLSVVNKQQVTMQVQRMIYYKYNFLSYNGMTKSKYTTIMSKGNLFDNKLIIIDEAHLFISAVVNKSELFRDMYRDLLNAKNAKFVLLTGTPIVNYPNEIAYTLNLLKGRTKVYMVPYKGKFVNEHLLANDPDIDQFNLKKSRNMKLIQITLTPTNFQRNADGKFVYVGDDTVAVSDIKRVRRIVERLKKSGVDASIDMKKVKNDALKLLPTDSDIFNDLFIDKSKQAIRNSGLFKQRIIGLVSYYESSDRELYPDNLGTTEEHLYFSDHQFNQYAKMRDKEIKKEQLAKKKKASNANDDFKKNGVFKTFSRILCNFAFPDEIDRPFPSNNIALMAGEIDDFDNEFATAVPRKKSASTKQITKASIYQDNLKTAMRSLRKYSDKYLSGDTLAEYSPKYARIIHHINNIDGSVLVYSQFRSVEGLGIFAMALEAMGFVEMKVSVETKKVIIDVKEEDYLKPKYARFSTDKEVSDVLLKIFNSDLASFDKDVRDVLEKMDVHGKKERNLRGSLIKVMMITQSGSAGISLKNVRQVHVMEPYWNKSRIDQVIGRANRTCSHIDLPPHERNFRVYTYKMRLTDQQKRRSMYIKSNDDNLSTDETIHNLAMRKDKVISSILKSVKEAAIDCSIHKQNDVDLNCFTFPYDVGDFEVAYSANINDDEEDAISRQRVTTVKLEPMKVTIKEHSYIWIKSTNELFDFALYQKTGVLDRVGLLENQNNGWYKLTVKKNQ